MWAVGAYMSVCVYSVFWFFSDFHLRNHKPLHHIGAWMCEMCLDKCAYVKQMMGTTFNGCSKGMHTYAHTHSLHTHLIQLLLNLTTTTRVWLKHSNSVCLILMWQKYVYQISTWFDQVKFFCLCDQLGQKSGHLGYIKK